MPSLIAMLALQAVVLAVIYAVSPYPVPMVAALTVWGGLNFAIGTPIQTRILGWTADAPNLASSLIPSGFNVGIALAASVGAMMLNAGFPYRSLPLLGVARHDRGNARCGHVLCLGAPQRRGAAASGRCGGTAIGAVQAARAGLHSIGRPRGRPPETPGRCARSRPRSA